MPRLAYEPEPKDLAIIRIWQIIEFFSYRNTPATVEMIDETLREDFGIELERKTISKKINSLKKMLNWQDGTTVLLRTAKGTWIKLREREIKYYWEPYPINMLNSTLGEKIPASALSELNCAEIDSFAMSILSKMKDVVARDHVVTMWKNSLAQHEFCNLYNVSRVQLYIELCAVVRFLRGHRLNKMWLRDMVPKKFLFEP